MSIDWSHLPFDIVAPIAERLLIDITDYVRFRAVCPLWRLATLHPQDPNLPIPLQSQWLVFNSKLRECYTELPFFNISSGKSHYLYLPELPEHKFIGYSNGWLVLCDIPSCAIYILNPLTRSRIQFPCLDKFVLMAIVSTSYPVTPIKYTLMFFLRDGVVCASAGDDKWVSINDSFSNMSALSYYGQLYTCNANGTMARLYFAPPVATMTPLVSHEAEAHVSWTYLVESSGEMLLVIQYLIEEPIDQGDATDRSLQNKFEVFKVNLTTSGWADLVSTKSLSDRVLFISEQHTFSVSSMVFPQLKGNCIYYGWEWEPTVWDIEKGVEDSLVHDLSLPWDQLPARLETYLLHYCNRFLTPRISIQKGKPRLREHRLF